MTDTQIKPATAKPPTEDLLHFYCECEPPKSYCGIPVIAEQVVDDDPVGIQPCLVCVELMGITCPRCGA